MTCSPGDTPRRCSCRSMAHGPSWPGPACPALLPAPSTMHPPHQTAPFAALVPQHKVLFSPLGMTSCPSFKSSLRGHFSPARKLPQAPAFASWPYLVPAPRARLHCSLTPCSRTLVLPGQELWEGIRWWGWRENSLPPLGKSSGEHLAPVLDNPPVRHIYASQYLEQGPGQSRAH